MLTDHRHQEILSRLHGTGRVGVADVALFLKVSEETIRRDLKMLEERGLLRRIHGGAGLVAVIVSGTGSWSRSSTPHPPRGSARARAVVRVRCRWVMVAPVVAVGDGTGRSLSRFHCVLDPHTV